MADTSTPVRTCVGCRRRAPVTELLRVVVRDGGLAPDPRRRLPGRGASLHPTAECLQAAVRRRAFPRSLRSSAPLETGPLENHLADQVLTDQPAGQGSGGAPQQHHSSTTVGSAPGRSARREQDVLG